VQEIRYEKLSPQLDTATLDEATELKFVVPPNTDYFTRYFSPPIHGLPPPPFTGGVVVVSNFRMYDQGERGG